MNIYDLAVYLAWNLLAMGLVLLAVIIVSYSFFEMGGGHDDETG